MDRTELLRKIYRSLDWAKLYELAPEAEREEVDGFFRDICGLLGGERAAIPRRAGRAVQAPSSCERAVLYCDGASRGNPGPAGIGVVIETPSGAELASWGRPIGKATCNVAEYTALLEGLRRAKELGAKRVDIRTDSQLLARQLNGRYRVKSRSLKPLFEEVGKLLATLDAWEVKHISRDLNGRADKLARDGRNAGAQALNANGS